MKNLKNQMLLLLLAGGAISLSACGNTKAESKTQTETIPVVSTNLEEKNNDLPAEASAVKLELEKAHAAGKAAFVVVSGAGANDTDKALEIAENATEIYKNAVVMELNRDDAANADLVNEWRLSGAPLPLILVVSSKGVLTGGRVLSQATAENIASLVPSPKLEAVYDAIGHSKYAIVTFTKKSFPDREEVLKECNEAVAALNNEAVLVEVDMENQAEKGFMDQVRIDPSQTDAPVTLVINKQGQVAGTATTIPDSDKLVAAAKTPVASGCGPGCGPAGCGQ